MGRCQNVLQLFLVFGLSAGNVKDRGAFHVDFLALRKSGIFYRLEDLDRFVEGVFIDIEPVTKLLQESSACRHGPVF